MDESNKYISESHIKYITNKVFKKCIHMSKLYSPNGSIKAQNFDDFKNCFIKFNYFLNDKENILGNNDE